MKNKQNMLIFGGYGLILLAFLNCGWQIVPMSEGFIKFVYMIATLSLWLSIGFFFWILWEKCAHLYKGFSNGIKNKDEE